MSEKRPRIDKWLWSIRIFKSRTLASEACRSGHVYINDVKAKPSSEVKEGDHVRCQKLGIRHEYIVLTVIQKRVGAPLAVTHYEDRTPEEELHKFDAWYIGKARPEWRDKGEGRPTKKDRRAIDAFKDKEGSEAID